MNIIYDLDEYNKNNMHFLEKKKNMMMDGKFTKLLYSNDYFTTIGLFLNIEFSLLITTSYVNNKSYIKLERSSNNNIIISKIFKMEKEMLQYYKILYGVKKNETYLLSNTLNDGNLKIYRKDTKNLSNVVLKISGIWESKDSIGITYKFIEGVNCIFNENSYL